MDIAIAVILVVLPALQIAVHYRHLPQRIAGHFNFVGRPSRYDDKRMFCVVYGAMMIIIAQFSLLDAYISLALGLFVVIVVEFVFRFNRDPEREHIGPGHLLIAGVFLFIFLAAIFFARSVESGG